MRSFGTSFVTFTGNAPGKSANSHVTVVPSRKGALAPPVVKYDDSSFGIRDRVEDDRDRPRDFSVDLELECHGGPRMVWI